MSNAEIIEHWGHNKIAFENGWGNVALPIKPGQKAPLWSGWQNASMVYDPETPGYAPEGFDLMGCGVGLRAGLDLGDGTCLIALDVDVKDWVWVGRIVARIRKKLGNNIVIREGNAPKTLTPLRVKVSEADGWKPKPIQVGNGQKIEVMYRGRQFVWEGIHPDTGKPYTHSVDILARGPASMEIVDLDTIKDLWAELETEFAVSAPVSTSGGVGAEVAVDISLGLDALKKGEDIHENLLRVVASKVNDGMDADMVREWLVAEKVLEGLPRDQDRLGDIADERSEIGRIIEGAVLKWAKGKRWEWLNECLRGVNSAAGEFAVASKVVGASSDDPFAPVSEQDAVLEKMAADLVKRFSPPKLRFNLVKDGWDTPMSQMAPTPWLDSGYLFLKGAAIAVQGKAEVNKSTWMLNYVLHLMTGVGGKAFGAEMQMTPKGEVCLTDEDKIAAGLSLKVLYLSADDPAAVVKKRVAAWADYWGVTGAALSSLNNRFMVLSVTEGVMDLRIDTPEGVEALGEMVQREGIDLVLGDPAANLLPAADGDNVEALGAMKRVIGALASLQVAGCLVFHTRKSANNEGAESTLDDIRGASAVGGAIRGSFAMRRLFGKELEEFGLDPKGAGLNVRILVHAKNNYGPRLPDRYYETKVVNLNNRGLAPGETSVLLVPWTPPASGGVPAHEIQTLITLLVRGDEDGNPYTDSSQAKTRRVYDMTDVELGWDEKKTKRVIKDLIDKGVVSKEEINVEGYDGRSRPKVMKGLKVLDETYDPSAECDPFAAI